MTVFCSDLGNSGAAVIGGSNVGGGRLLENQHSSTPWSSEIVALNDSQTIPIDVQSVNDGPMWSAYDMVGVSGYLEAEVPKA